MADSMEFINDAMYMGNKTLIARKKLNKHWQTFYTFLTSAELRHRHESLHSRLSLIHQH